jgi:C1A family cysteine protease
MKKFKKLILTMIALVSLAVLLTACPGSKPTNSDLFNEANAWKDPIPSDAEVVTPEEFERRIKAGETELVSTESLAAQKVALDKKFQDEKSYLAGLPEKSEYVTQLLEQTANSTTFVGDVTVEGPSGPVVLLGLGNQILQAAETQRLSQDVNNALDVYTLTYGLLPENLKSQAVTPESLKGKPLADVEAALSKLNELLGTLSSSQLDGVRLEAETTSNMQTQALNAGNGSDNNGVCNPTNLFRQYWFPLKNFISPVKAQGMRGTCWAFAAIGALESRERVQNNNLTDLSEQFLVNKVKEDWDSDDNSDGYRAEAALELAVDEGQVFPNEGGWTYNRSMSRPNNSYANSCNSYTGDCSDTSHQSRRVCTDLGIFDYCSYATVKYNGAGVSPSNTRQIWANGSPFILNLYRVLLSQGHVIMASFPIYTGFDNPTNGFVTDYAKTGARGGHAVQIVGFLSNNDLATPGNPANIGGGGYFIIKNSWGCGAGDGGYYYIPADYVSSIFNRLSILSFDNRRSDAWNKEQANPGSAEAPKIEIESNPAKVDLRVETDLAAFFKVSHSVSKSVSLSITSNVLGTIYDGPWSTDPFVLFGPSFRYVFNAEQRHNITLTARYAGNESTASFALDVVNTAPTLELSFSGDPRQNEDFFITAIVRDPNESNLCPNTTWLVDAPDTVANPTGCSQRVRFANAGSRQMTVTTRDSEGLIATKTINLTVLPPLENPFPRIKSAGVFSREVVTSGAGLRFCGEQSVSQGSTIDLRNDGCKLGPSSPDRPRYYANVEIENPSNETLSYLWKLYVFDPANNSEFERSSDSSPIFDLTRGGNESLVTRACRITLTIIAPEDSRSKKDQPIWNGNCTYLAAQIN